MNEIFTIVSCLTGDAWKASRRGDLRRQVNRLDIPDPRRVGGHRMKFGMTKAYRVAPPAVECTKVETNIVDAKEDAPESEAGRCQKGWAFSQKFEDHLRIGLITAPIWNGHAVGRGQTPHQPLFWVVQLYMVTTVPSIT